MSATLAASQAILKVRYPDGRLPKEVYDRAKAKVVGIVEKREDFTGDFRVVALQNENPQGSAGDVATAQGSLAQGSYKRFQVPRIEHFGIARIKGQALQAAAGNEGALVDLWTNETNGISTTELINHEIYVFGNGSATLGQITSGQATATITLATPTDASKFALNMRVMAVSDATLSPTLRSGTATITGIDRVLGKLTVGTTWVAAIPGITATDFLVRAGDAAAAGVATVLMGIEGWIAGSTAGTLFQLDRSTDTVRLAGQVISVAGLPLEEALVEASSQINQQGAPQPKLAMCHPRDLANFKKSLSTKVTYEKASVQSTMAGVSFPGIEVEGDEGRIKILTSPFIQRFHCHLLYEESWKLDSLKPAPHLQNYDGSDFLRVQSDDAYECRFASYLNFYTNMPFANAVLTGFGQ